MAADLRAATATLRESGSRWRGFEQLTGWSILGLTFSGGEILGLRVFPYSDLAPYRSIWHRDSAGAWRVYVDGPSLEVGCPRWWGPALESARLASIQVEWSGPGELRVTMAEPALDWTVNLAERPMEKFMNLASAPMPAWSWRPRALRAPREWMAHWALGMGHVQLDGLAPAGMPVVLMPERIYGIAASRATWEGRDLGEAVAAATEPRVGDFSFPTRGVLAIGDFRARIRDEAQFRDLQSRFKESPQAPERASLSAVERQAGAAK
jgi:hypothetical protein